jgi:hypothetical protein
MKQIELMNILTFEDVAFLEATVPVLNTHTGNSSLIELLLRQRGVE